MAAQRSLAARLGARLELLGHLLQHLDVGRDTLRLDRASGGGEVARGGQPKRPVAGAERNDGLHRRSEEHTSELQSQSNLVCRLLLEKKKTKSIHIHISRSVER